MLENALERPIASAQHYNMWLILLSTTITIGLLIYESKDCKIIVLN